MMAMTGRARGHQTQWAAQFAVASELCKRGYEVAFACQYSELLMAVSPETKTHFGGCKAYIDREQVIKGRAHSCLRPGITTGTHSLRLPTQFILISSSSSAISRPWKRPFSMNISFVRSPATITPPR